jgi:uncharacterized protein
MHATIRLYGDLAELAWGVDRSGEGRVPAQRPRSVKDAIESLGVPHTEVGLVVTDGRSVAFDHQVVAGDRVSVYPPFLDLDLPSKVLPPPLESPRFVLDVHLGRLAERLRILGFDALYESHLDDADLAALSVAGPRWLLTRDRGLLMRKVVTHGYLVRATDPDAQVHEVVRRFALSSHVRPFTRCARCNGLLESVDKAAIAHLLGPGTRRDHEVFVRCCGCGRLYWEGSHSDALRRFVDDVRAAADAADLPWERD